MPELSEKKRPRPAENLNEYGTDIARLFEARDTMKRAKTEYEEARKTITLLFDPIKKAFDMPDFLGSKPSSPKDWNMPNYEGECIDSLRWS